MENNTAFVPREHKCPVCQEPFEAPFITRKELADRIEVKWDCINCGSKGHSYYQMQPTGCHSAVCDCNNAPIDVSDKNAKGNCPVCLHPIEYVDNFTQMETKPNVYTRAWTCPCCRAGGDEHFVNWGGHHEINKLGEVRCFG